MSNALAIAGVTAVLRDLLNDGLINNSISGTLGNAVTVSVLAPDRVVAANGTENSQLNLFLHQVTPNLGWRNEGLPSRDASGRSRLSNPPLALDLHYLLTAYSAGDLHAEILLGYGMQLLHEMPVLTRRAIETAIRPAPDVGDGLPPALRALADSGLESQIEQIKITPEYLTTDEMSKIWTAIQSHFRPSAAYRVTVVLIQREDPARIPLPVLSRGAVDPSTGRDRGVVVRTGVLPPFPTIDAVAPEGGQPAAIIDQEVTLSGHHLDGDDREVVLENDRYQIAETLPATGASRSDALTFTIPEAQMDAFPAGIYRINARLVRPGDDAARSSNRLALTVAPSLPGLPMTVNRAGDGTASFTLDIHPPLWRGQTAVLSLGQQEYLPQEWEEGDTQLEFVIEQAPIGAHLAVLRVDGVGSPIIDRSATPPTFLDQRITIQ